VEAEEVECRCVVGALDAFAVGAEGGFDAFQVGEDGEVGVAGFKLGQRAACVHDFIAVAAGCAVVELEYVRSVADQHGDAATPWEGSP